MKSLKFVSISVNVESYVVMVTVMVVVMRV